MSFKVDAAGHVQELMEALAYQLVAREAGPGFKRGVDLRDATVGPDREIAARSVLEEVLVFVDGAELRHTL